MYTVEVEGIKYPVSAKTYFSMISPLLGFVFGMIAWFAYMIHFSTSMLAYHTSLHPVVAVIILAVLLIKFEQTENGEKKEFALLPKKARKIILFSLIFATFIHLYAVENWTVIQVILMSIPMIIARYNKMVFKYFKGFIDKKVKEVVTSHT